MIAALIAGGLLGATILAIPWFTILAINAVFGTAIEVNAKTWFAMFWLIALLQAGRSSGK